MGNLAGICPGNLIATGMPSDLSRTQGFQLVPQNSVTDDQGMVHESLPKAEMDPVCGLCVDRDFHAHP